MCVAIGGLRKNLRRAEQLEGMKCNHYGFSILVLRDKKVVAYQRSLKEEDIMKVWDEAKDDDYIVTHSRIPSAGGHNANLEDCHLWMREGCYFAHNGTMTNIIDMMDNSDRRTDSLYCFEEIFLPLWKSQGRNFNALVEKTMKAVTYGNRIVIVTPDGEVHYLGNWVEDHGCLMSNTSYKVRETSGFGVWSGSSWPSSGPSADPRSTRTSSTPTAASGTATDKVVDLAVRSPGCMTSLDYDLDGSIIRTLADDWDLGKLLLLHTVTTRVADLAAGEVADELSLANGAIPSAEGAWKNREYFYSKAHKMFGRTGPVLTGSEDFAFSSIDEIFGDEFAPLDEKDVESALGDYATMLEYDCAPTEFKDGLELAEYIEKSFSAFKVELAVHAKALNVGTDWAQPKVRKAFTCWRMMVNRKRRPTIVERRLEDIMTEGLEKDESKAYMDNVQTFYEIIRGKRR